MISAADDGSDGAFGASRVGAELRAARLRLGWTLPEVAAHLRIRLPYLEAIEEGRIADLPGNAYAVGFLRSYASLLGLDAAEVARRFRAEAHEVNRKPELAFPAPVPERGVPAGAVVLLGALIAAGAYAGWYKFSGDTRSPTVVVPAVPERLAPLADRAAPPSNPSPQVASILPPPGQSPLPASPVAPPLAGTPPASSSAPAPAPAVVPVPAPAVVPIPTAVPADVGRMVLRAKADAWVQVREKQGPILLNRVLRSGETWPVPKGQPVLLTTGNAGATEVVIDGTAAPTLGGLGVVRRDIPLDPDTAKIGPASTPRPSPQ